MDKFKDRISEASMGKRPVDKIAIRMTGMVNKLKKDRATLKSLKSKSANKIDKVIKLLDEIAYDIVFEED